VNTKTIKSALTTVAALLLFSTLTLAQQTGKITGVVVDAETGETLIGVNVVIEGTTTGAATDIDGRYTIPGLEPGTYNLVVSYISFQKQTITGVQLSAGEVVKLDVTLQPENEFLEEVVVTAEAVLDNEAGLLRQRQKSVAFSDAISAESISRSGAGDAASAMKKVVGASVVGGKYVYVRGLGDRYTGTQLNGSNLPSADPDRKSFQMDLFPTNLIENITTSKTFTPDKPGNFTGGLVDVTTKDFPEKLTFSLSYSSEYNSQSSFDDVLLGPSSDTDFLGFDNGERELPDFLDEIASDPNLEFPNVIEARRNLGAADTLNRLSRSFNNVMEADEDFVPVNQSFSLSLGNITKLAGRDLGYNLSLSYSQSYQSYFDGRQARWELFGNNPDQSDSLSPELNLSDARGDHNVDIGALANISYKFSPNHKLTTTFIRTQSGTNTGRTLAGSNIEEVGSADPLFQSRVVRYVERNLSSVQLKGKSFFPGFLNTTVEWGGSYSQNNQEEPDLRFFQSETRFREFPNGVVDTLFSINSSGGRKPPARFFRDLQEDGFNFNLDVSVPFPTHTGQNGLFKFGGSFDNADREFREFRFEYQLANFDVVSFDAVNGDSDEFFNAVGIVDTAANGDFIFGHTISDVTELRNNYDGEREIKAIYGMIELPLLDNLKFIGGARLEDTFVETVSQDTAEAIGELDDTDILPSLSLIYSLNDRMNFRGAFTKTLARPTFRELAPFVSFNFVGDFLFRGSADLERTLITNYDIRWEWFMSPGEVIAVSGFYKDFKDPLERAISIDFGNNVISIQNVDEARVYGLELELRKRLNFLPPLFHNFLISTNLSLVESEVDIPRIELFEILNINSQATPAQQDSIIAAAPEDLKTRELNGQSPFTFNFDVSYENPAIGFNAALNYNIFGDRLETVRRGRTPNIFERSYGTLNFVSSKRLGKHLKLKFSAENLLNPEIETTQRFKDIDFVNTSNTIGRSFKLGVSYDI